MHEVFAGNGFFERMHFLQPGYLWALPVLIVPVIIHLFNLQRSEKVVFANTRMLENLVRQTRKARNLRHLLLLLLRLLALACLILAFAQPVFSGYGNSEAQSGEMPAVSVYADDSPGMLLQEDESTALERALAFASSIPSVFNNKGWFRLTGNEGKPGSGWVSASVFRDQVLDVQKAASQKSLKAVLAQAYRQFSLRSAGEKKHVYLISDFQRRMFDQFQPSMLDSGVIHHFIPVAHAPVPNFWIDSAWTLSSETGQEKTDVHFRLRSTGLKEKKLCRVQLFDGSNLQAGQQLEIQPGQDATAALRITRKWGEVRQLRLEVDDPLVAWDNRFFLVLRSPKPLKVLRMGDQPNPVLSRLFSSSPAFRYSESPLQNPDYEAMEASDLIIADKASSIGEALSSRFSDGLEAGKTICILPDPESGFAFQMKGNLAMEIPQSKGIGAEEMQRISLPGADNSFFKNTFADPGKNPVLPEMPCRFDLSPAGFPVLRYQNGQVFLSRMERGEGNLFLFAADPSSTKSTFHRHPLMLASFFRMAAESRKDLQGSLCVSRQANQVFLQPDSGFVPGEGLAELRNGNLRVQAGIGKSGDKVFVQTDCNRLGEGFWEVFQNGKRIDAFAINRDAAESQADYYSPEEIRGLLPDKPWIKVQELGTNLQQEHLKSGVEQGLPLWKILLLLAIFFLLGEALFTVYTNRPVTS